jgi:hypothetical protein
MEIPRGQVKRRSVMPVLRRGSGQAPAGIHLCSRYKTKESLDSGLRRNDGLA